MLSHAIVKNKAQLYVDNGRVVTYRTATSLGLVNPTETCVVPLND